MLSRVTVPLAVPSEAPWVGAERLTENDSLLSYRVSSRIDTVIVLLVSPDVKDSVPDTAV